jgi:hypothetical protein
MAYSDLDWANFVDVPPEVILWHHDLPQCAKKSRSTLTAIRFPGHTLISKIGSYDGTLVYFDIGRLIR